MIKFRNSKVIFKIKCLKLIDLNAKLLALDIHLRFNAMNISSKVKKKTRKFKSFRELIPHFPKLMNNLILKILYLD